MTRKTLRKIEAAKENIESMTWTEIFNGVMCLDEINNIIEERFTKENEELREFKRGNDDWHEQQKAERKLDMIKAEWTREYIKNFDK